MWIGLNSLKTFWQGLPSQNPSDDDLSTYSNYDMTLGSKPFTKNLGRLSQSPLSFFLVGYAIVKNFSYLFGVKFTGRKFHWWRHDNWVSDIWRHSRQSTCQSFLPLEFIVWFKSTQAKQVDRSERRIIATRFACVKEVMRCPKSLVTDIPLERQTSLQDFPASPCAVMRAFKGGHRFW